MMQLFVFNFFDSEVFEKDIGIFYGRREDMRLPCALDCFSNQYLTK